MRKQDKITVNDVSITIKELTVSDVRHWMMDMMEKKESEAISDLVDSVLDQGLYEDIGVSDLLRMTDLSTDIVNDFTPSQLRYVIDKCKALNPDFFGMRKRVLNKQLWNA